MMDTPMQILIQGLALAALLGGALVGGVFFAFSSFVMKALARLPAAEGIAAMQSINVVVINRSFLGAFLGTALLSLAVVGLLLFDWRHPQAAWFLAAALCYFAGTFLVTVLGNVPLNDRLADVSPTDPAAQQLWQQYLRRWTAWNHVRTAAAATAVLMGAAGLAGIGGA